LSEADIPEEVRRFLREHISSLFQLELLLLLYEKKAQGWCAEDANRELHSGPELVRRQLEDFHSRGLVSRSEDSEVTYQYNPVTAELDHAVSAVAKVYKERRVSVTAFIYSSPVDNIRIFAEAFRIRKDE
jgi:hypothetical protein